MKKKSVKYESKKEKKPHHEDGTDKTQAYTKDFPIPTKKHNPSHSHIHAAQFSQSNPFSARPQNVQPFVPVHVNPHTLPQNYHTQPATGAASTLVFSHPRPPPSDLMRGKP